MSASRHRLPAFCDFCLQPNAMNNAERCHGAQLGRPLFTRHTWLYTWRVTEVAVEVWFSCCWLLDPAGGRLRSASSEAQRGLARTLSWWSCNKWHLALLCIESSPCELIAEDLNCVCVSLSNVMSLLQCCVSSSRGPHRPQRWSHSCCQGSRPPLTARRRRVSRWKFPLQPHWTKGREDVWEATKWNIKEPPTLQLYFFSVSRFVFSSSWMERQRMRWTQRFGQTLGEVRSCSFFAQSRLRICKCSCLLKQSPVEWFLQGSYKLKHWTKHFKYQLKVEAYVTFERKSTVEKGKTWSSSW